MSSPNSERAPRLGDKVEFVYGDQRMTALITDPAYAKSMDDGSGVSPPPPAQALVVFPPNGPSFTTVASHDSNGAPASWVWPDAGEA